MIGGRARRRSPSCPPGDCPQQVRNHFEVHEARVVDAAKRNGWSLAVADGVDAEHPARALDRRPRLGPDAAAAGVAASPSPAVRHVVEALVDDPDRLANLIHADQVPRQRVAPSVRVGTFGSRAADRRCTGGPVERRTGCRRHARCRRWTPNRRAISRFMTPTPRARRTKISFLIEEPGVGFGLALPRGSSSRRGRLMNSWLRSPFTPPMRK